MSRYGNLIKNIGFLTVSNFGSRILTFLLIPIYTAVLTTEEYGSFDIIYTTVSLLLPVLTLGISDGAMRFLLDNKDNKSDIYRITLRVVLTSVVVVALLAGLNSIFNILPVVKSYWLFFLCHYIVFTLYQVSQDIARGLDKLKNLAISGLVNSVALLVFNLLFLLVFKWGLNGYFLANIVANLLATLVIVFSTKYYKDINRREKIDGELRKEMIKYSRPMVLNSVGWWINNVSDRYVILFILGAAANGVYSVAYKIPTILSVFQTIFNQAWTVSLIKGYDSEKSRKYVEDVYGVYAVLMLVLCSATVLFNKTIASFLYFGEFFIAWKYVPLLVFAALFSSLSGLLGAIFGAEKDSKALSSTTMIGAVVNVILNIIFINLMGVIGAALATAISSFVVWLSRYIKCQKYIRFHGANMLRHVFSFLLLGVQVLICSIFDNTIIYGIQIPILFLIVFINADIFKSLLTKAREKRSRGEA